MTAFPWVSPSAQRCVEMSPTRALPKQAEPKKPLTAVPHGLLQRTTGNPLPMHHVPPIVHEVLRSPGEPLGAATRAFMEPRFGHDFSGVRVHTDAKAAESAQAMDALAYTAGQDIVFAHGYYTPKTNQGRLLVSHELAHVVQQGVRPAGMSDRLEVDSPLSPLEGEAAAFADGTRLTLSESGIQVQRQPRVGAGSDKPELPKLKYKAAEQSNKAFAKPNSLGWESKLSTVSGGKFKGWADLWKAGQFDEFADAVAQFQLDSGFRKTDIDGILGLGTWSKIAGYGEAIAGIENVQWEKSETTCTMATRERILRGYKLATGKQFELPEDKSEKIFNVILQSIEGRMADVDKQYRGAGAAGAMVYAGLATFVNEADIWTGGLRPGAPMQVWGHRDAYDLMQAGTIKDAKTGKQRRITPDDANFFGTSFVFVRYDDPAKPTKMLVRHFGGEEWKKRSDFKVWVGANIN